MPSRRRISQGDLATPPAAAAAGRGRAVAASSQALKPTLGAAGGATITGAADPEPRRGRRTGTLVGPPGERIERSDV